MRGNHHEARQPKSTTYVMSYCRARLNRLTLSDSNSANLSHSRFKLQPILILFLGQSLSRFLLYIQPLIDQIWLLTHAIRRLREKSALAVFRPLF